MADVSEVFAIPLRSSEEAGFCADLSATLLEDSPTVQQFGDIALRGALPEGGVVVTLEGDEARRMREGLVEGLKEIKFPIHDDATQKQLDMMRRIIFHAGYYKSEHPTSVAA